MKRNAFAASILSLLLPGLGHLYAGYPAAAARRYVAYLTMALFAVGMLWWFPIAAVSLPVAVAALLGTYGWIVFGAARAARGAQAEHPLRAWDRWYVYGAIWLGSLVVHYVAKAPLRSRIQAFRIPSTAMEPTILVGDFLWASVGRDLRNDSLTGLIVISESPAEPGVLTVKRVVGVAGDTIEMIENTLYRNGAAVREPYIRVEGMKVDPSDPQMLDRQRRLYIGPRPADYHPSARNWGPLLVPADSVFLLGDNRDNSYDSRYLGVVATDRLRGTPVRIYYSYDRDSPRPFPALTAIRWDRLGKPVQ